MTKLISGTLAGGVLTSGSMSRMIFDALNTLTPMSANENPIARQNLALAIAQGVIGHLKAQESAFSVDVSDAGGAITRTLTIDV